MGERLEALMRIPVAIVTGIILEIWEVFIIVGGILHLVLVLITGKRVRSLAKFSNLYATVQYSFIRYVYFADSKRPFPFTGFPKEKDPLDFKRR